MSNSLSLKSKTCNERETFHEIIGLLVTIKRWKGATDHVSLRSVAYSHGIVNVRTWLSFSSLPYRKRKRFYLYFQSFMQSVGSWRKKNFFPQTKGKKSGARWKNCERKIKPATVATDRREHWTKRNGKYTACENVRSGKKSNKKKSEKIMTSCKMSTK